MGHDRAMCGRLTGGGRCPASGGGGAREDGHGREDERGGEDGWTPDAHDNSPMRGLNGCRQDNRSRTAPVKVSGRLEGRIRSRAVRGGTEPRTRRMT
jgi:hypothetical protein